MAVKNISVPMSERTVKAIKMYATKENVSYKILSGKILEDFVDKNRSPILDKLEAMEEE